MKDDVNKMIFAYLTTADGAQSPGLMLAESIRSFAGDYSDAPIWVLVPQAVEEMPAENKDQFAALDVRLQAFEIDGNARQFPFASKVYASAAAESLADGQSEILVWMDRGSLVIQEPRQMLLKRGKKLACRPVDHILIGSPYDQPLDPYWEFVYQSCGVKVDDIFPMITSADQIKIRPYINAGMLVVRPEIGLLRNWRDTFQRLYQDSRLMDFYQQNRLYEIFTHQTILAGSILSTLKQTEIEELNHLVNYPLHMHSQYPSDRRPEYMDDLVSFRYETIFDDPDWGTAYPVKEPLKSWLSERVNRMVSG